MSISPETAQSLQNLSDKDKQELNQFISHESTSRMASSIAASTDVVCSPEGSNPSHSALIDRHVLQEVYRAHSNAPLRAANGFQMHNVQDLVRQAGPLRRTVHEKLC